MSEASGSYSQSASSRMHASIVPHMSGGKGGRREGREGGRKGGRREGGRERGRKKGGTKASAIL